MEKLNPAQCQQIIQLNNENQCSTMTVIHKLRETYGQHNWPTVRTIHYTIVTIVPYPARSQENIAAVAESVRDNYESIRHR